MHCYKKIKIVKKNKLVIFPLLIFVLCTSLIVLEATKAAGVAAYYINPGEIFTIPELSNGTAISNHTAKTLFIPVRTEAERISFLNNAPANINVYIPVQIGTRYWMSRNLNEPVGNSVCYDNNSLNCQIYGRLYNWDDALVACPSGWHLSTLADISNLVSSAGNSAMPPKDPSVCSGCGSLGFNALMGGIYASSFSSVGSGAYFSSSAQSTYEDSAKGLVMNAPIHIAYWGENGTIRKSYYVSVRCVKD